MARTRQIKPGFFLNEDLGALSPLARLFFAGLWCVADRDGRMEDRPRKLRAEVLPYDAVDGEELVAALVEHGFLIRYEAGGAKYLAIARFAEHQNPHPKEAASEIPAPGTDGETEKPRQVTETPLLDSDEQRTSPALPSYSSSPSLPSSTSSDLDIQKPEGARKRATVVDEAFKRSMYERFPSRTPERIDDEIADALGHSAAKKRTDLQAYVRNWLVRAFDEPRGVTQLRPPTGYLKPVAVGAFDHLIHRSYE